MYKSGTLAIFRETTQGEHKQKIKTQKIKKDLQQGHLQIKPGVEPRYS
jgi:hypothetical protein